MVNGVDSRPEPEEGAGVQRKGQGQRERDRRAQRKGQWQRERGRGTEEGARAESKRQGLKEEEGCLGMGGE